MLIAPIATPPRRQFLGTLAAGTVLAAGASNASAALPAGRLSGKVALITGATSGIGRATAETLAREGAKVAFCGRREALGREVEAGIRTAGGEASYIRADVRRAEEVAAFVAGTIERYGRLDIAFNNAGTDKPPAPIAETDIEGFDDLIATNLRGIFLAMKYEIPSLLETNGVIVNNASIGGRHAFPNIVGYSAAKAAVIHMTRAAAQEYGPGLRINAIAPGCIETPMLARVRRDWKVTTEQLVAAYPAKRVGQPEEVAAVVAWLATDAASYVSGHVIGVDGGDLP